MQLPDSQRGQGTRLSTIPVSCKKAFMALFPWTWLSSREEPGLPLPTREVPVQLAQDFRFSGFLWLLSPLASAAVSEARLVAEPEIVALLRASGAA